jgi:hypothetical protein
MFSRISTARYAGGRLARLAPCILRVTAARRAPLLHTQAQQGEPSPNLPPAWVQTLNHAIEQHRLYMVGCYIIGDALSVGATFGLVTALQLDVSADFALAFAIARLTRRFRLPLDAAVAGILARLYPALAQVHLTRLLLNRPPGQGGFSAPGEKPGFFSKVTNALGGMLDRYGGMLDRYGLAFTVAQRMVVGLATVGGIYSAIRAGVDVQAALESWDIPIAAEAGKTAGRWALGVTAAAPLYPAVVMGSAKASTWLGQIMARRMAALARARAARAAGQPPQRPGFSQPPQQPPPLRRDDRTGGAGHS